MSPSGKGNPMGKKPVLGLLGLAWVGLALSGCKDCCCGNSGWKKDSQPTARRTTPPTDAMAQSRPRSVEQAPIAAKGAGTPQLQHPYNFPTASPDVPAPPSSRTSPPVETVSVPSRQTPPTTEGPVELSNKPVPETPASVPMTRPDSAPIHEIPSPQTVKKVEPSPLPKLPDPQGAQEPAEKAAETPPEIPAPSKVDTLPALPQGAPEPKKTAPVPMPPSVPDLPPSLPEM